MPPLGLTCEARSSLAVISSSSSISFWNSAPTGASLRHCSTFHETSEARVFILSRTLLLLELACSIDTGRWHRLLWCRCWRSLKFCANRQMFVQSSKNAQTLQTVHCFTLISLRLRTTETHVSHHSSLHNVHAAPRALALADITWNILCHDDLLSLVLIILFVDFSHALLVSSFHNLRSCAI